MESIGARGSAVTKKPTYSKLPLLNIGQTIKALVKLEGNYYSSRVRKIEGTIIFKNDFMVTVQNEKYKESITLIDFRTNCARLV